MQDLQAEAEDSVSIRVSWKSPAQPNGRITRYRLQVLVDDVQLQDITLTADVVRYSSAHSTISPVEPSILACLPHHLNSVIHKVINKDDFAAFFYETPLWGITIQSIIKMSSNRV